MYAYVYYVCLDIKSIKSIASFLISCFLKFLNSTWQPGKFVRQIRFECFNCEGCTAPTCSVILYFCRSTALQRGPVFIISTLSFLMCVSFSFHKIPASESCVCCL